MSSKKPFDSAPGSGRAGSFHRYYWIPVFSVVALLAVHMVDGDAFTPPGRPGEVVTEDFAAATPKKDASAAKPTAAKPTTPAPTPAAGSGDGTRLGGVVSNSVDADAAAKKVEKLRADLKTRPKDYRLNYELGNALYDAGDQNGAITAYKKAIELNPKFVKAYVNLGETQRDKGDVKDAIATLEKASQLDPKDDLALAALGFAYYSDKRYPDAMHQFDRALKLNPRSVHATYYMGMAFADAQIYREAIKWWDKVCEIDPNSDACIEARDNNNLLRRIVN